MRFYLVLFFCVSIFFIACGDDKDKVPPQYLQLHQMAAVLTDVHIVDGSLYNVPPQPDSLAKHGLGTYLAVFKAYGTDTATFKNSLKYYTMRPDLMIQVYAGIELRLTKRLDSLKKLKPKIDPDSVHKIKTKLSMDSVSHARARFDSLAKKSLMFKRGK